MAKSGGRPEIIKYTPVLEASSLVPRSGLWLKIKLSRKYCILTHSPADPGEERTSSSTSSDIFTMVYLLDLDGSRTESRVVKSLTGGGRDKCHALNGSRFSATNSQSSVRILFSFQFMLNPWSISSNNYDDDDGVPHSNRFHRIFVP